MGRKRDGGSQKMMGFSLDVVASLLPSALDVPELYLRNQFPSASQRSLRRLKNRRPEDVKSTLGGPRLEGCLKASHSDSDVIKSHKMGFVSQAIQTPSRSAQELPRAPRFLPGTPKRPLGVNASVKLPQGGSTRGFHSAVPQGGFHKGEVH